MQLTTLLDNAYFELRSAPLILKLSAVSKALFKTDMFTYKTKRSITKHPQQNRCPASFATVFNLRLLHKMMKSVHCKQTVGSAGQREFSA